MKPDKTCHFKSNEGTTAKKATLPGQMYVPKKIHNESNFVGEGKNQFHICLLFTGWRELLG